MAEFMLHHTHEAEECGKLYEEWKKYDTPLKGKDYTFFCSCPSGEHGGFTHVNAESKDDALALMPEMHRRTPGCGVARRCHLMPNQARVRRLRKIEAGALTRVPEFGRWGFLPDGVYESE